MIQTILLAFITSFIFGFAYRHSLKLFKRKGISNRAKLNIGKNDKAVRFILGVVLLIYGIWTNSFWVLFGSGFCFFEAIFSWCGFYALIGKNTCEI